MLRIGSGLDTINFGEAAGDWSDLTNIPPRVQAIANNNVLEGLSVSDGLQATGGLDVQGFLSIDSAYVQEQAEVSTVADSAGSFDDVALPNAGVFKYWRYTTDAGHNAWTGLAAPDAGRRLVIVVINVGGGNLTFEHQDAGSTDGNRFECPGGVDFLLPPGASVSLRHEAVGLGQWRVLS